MGKALYRKYRSKTLDDVVGQEHITNTLKNALKKNSISHAYLFTGPRGVGKTSVARILAHEINKLDYDEESTHLDIIEIDAASNRRIDEIRDLREKVHIAPTSAKYKVYIIDEVHMLTREAFNALLKTLEEPPEHAIFILATTEAHKVPDTIISRTQQFSFRPINSDNAVIHLRMIADEEGLDITDQALKLIAEHGKGSFRDSISMLDQISGLTGVTIDEDKVSELLGIPSRVILENLLDACANSDSSKLFANTQKLKEKGSSPSNISQSLIDLLREQIVNKNTTLPIVTTIELMKNLLPSTGSQSSFEQIEIALLEAIQIEDTPKLPLTNKEDAESIAVQEEASENIETIEEENLNIVLKDNEVIPKNLKNEGWDEVLKTLKNKHNTLYGILRMADVNIEGEKITLTFSFEFHRKQLKQSKNLEVLQAVIIDRLGKKHEIDLLVSKTANNKADHKEKKENDVIKSINNIFDGAELLES